MDTARTYNTLAGMLAAVIGAALFAVAFWATSEGGPMPVHWPDIFSPPAHLTPLFALPLCLFWMGAGRMRATGLVVFVAATTLLHWGAMSEAVHVGSTARTDHLEGVLAGATGGAIGSVGTWLVLMLMGPAFRTGRAATIMIIAAVALIAIGAYGVGLGSPANLMAFLSGKPFEGIELEPNRLIVNLYLPWQLIYGLALVVLFKDRQV